ncbi:MAG: bifunctional phosphoribosyl-AMP cyclohydrolase/phosphoribosyl-ATP diphosphatase HisIE [Epsilonproteobacteria bacterium]|nr:bifunctional phosphoribosyl-AMP cyclohydrolase/phosphoribosyl-ATP diphosphatase HisIE [Campylobacterota bacterium]
MIDLSKIDFKKQDGIIPVVVQDNKTLEVLMVAYMDEKALKLSIETGYAHYFSRSKQRLWKKGEESGHTQKIIEMFIDCDNDTLLLKVMQEGVACHTGRKSCFFTNLITDEIVSKVEVDLSQKYSVIDQLYHTILERKNSDSSKSYTATLLNGKENSLLKKIVEEAGELTFALKDNDESEIIYESADVAYHILVALAKHDISPDRVKQELARRFGLSGIDEKNSRNK